MVSSYRWRLNNEYRGAIIRHCTWLVLIITKNSLIKIPLFLRSYSHRWTCNNSNTSRILAFQGWVGLQRSEVILPHPLPLDWQLSHRTEGSRGGSGGGGCVSLKGSDPAVGCLAKPSPLQVRVLWE